MGPYTEYPRSAPSTKHEALWDPSSVLETENTSPGYQYITCAGYAPSQGRCCRISIRRDNREFIQATLNEIAYLKPDSPAVTSRLRAIAGPALCVRYHQNQAEVLVQQWQRRIRHMKPQRERVNTEPAPNVRTQDVKSDQALKDALEELRKMREYLAELEGKLQDRDGERKEEPKNENRQDEDDKVPDQERRQREERDRQAKREEEERKEKKRKEDEQKDKERREEERKKSEQREKERAQEEEREKRHREREQRKVREEAARAERARLAREAAQKERTEWDRCWNEYQSRWKDFLANPATFERQDFRDVVPWPVRSGLYRDVKVSTVKEFLRTAPPREEGQEVNMAKLMRQECTKWHPDKVDAWLKKWKPCATGPNASEQKAEERVTVAEKMVLEAISRAVTDLLNEAAARKSDLQD